MEQGFELVLCDILWFCLNPCLHCCLYRCFLCRYCVCKWILMLTDVWKVILSTCTFTYVVIMNCLLITCIYMFWNLSPRLKVVLSFIQQNLVFIHVVSDVFKLLWLYTLSLHSWILHCYPQNHKNNLWFLRCLNTAIL